MMLEKTKFKIQVEKIDFDACQFGIGASYYLGERYIYVALGKLVIYIGFLK